MVTRGEPQRMVLTSCLSQVAPAEKAVLDLAKAHGFPEPQRFALRLALEEALVNAIKHGNCGDPAKSVTLDYQVSDSIIRLSITDQGCGFNPRKVPNPTSLENLTKPSGRGILLMRAYMSKVRFNPAGNKVTLEMKKQANAPTPRKPAKSAAPKQTTSARSAKRS